MDSYLISHFLFYGLIFAAFFFSWRIGKNMLKKKGIIAAITASILASTIILTICGAIWHQIVPDLIGKGIILFIYSLAIAAGNVLVISLLLYKKSSQKGWVLFTRLPTKWKSIVKIWQCFIMQKITEKEIGNLKFICYTFSFMHNT